MIKEIVSRFVNIVMGVFAFPVSSPYYLFVEKIKPRWDNDKKLRIYTFSFFSTVSLIVMFWAVYLRFVQELPWADWTGLEGKTLWDWLDLFIIPAVLAIGAFLFNRSERKSEMEIAKMRRVQEQRIATNRQMDIAMQSYIEYMATLLHKEKLGDSHTSSVIRSVAKSRTLAVLRMLDSRRKGYIIQFLYDADLIKSDTKIIDLTRADLYKTYIGKIELTNIDLSGSYLMAADLCGVSFRNAKFTGTSLRGTNLSEANLEGADFSEADLTKTNLQRAKYNSDTKWPDKFNPELVGAVFVEYKK